MLGTEECFKIRKAVVQTKTQARGHAYKERAQTPKFDT